MATATIATSSYADSALPWRLWDQPRFGRPYLRAPHSNGILLTSEGDCALLLLRPKEECIDISLPPGTYTAILAGKNGGTGIGLVEIYHVQ